MRNIPPTPPNSDNNELPERSICWDDPWQWSCYTFGDQHWLEDFGVTWETLDERAGTALSYLRSQQKVVIQHTTSIKLIINMYILSISDVCFVGLFSKEMHTTE